MVAIMNKRSIRKILLGLLILFAGLVLLYVVVLFKGEKIEHDKQVLLPTKGQVVYCREYDMMNSCIPFYFYDEKELSEMADADNIQAITLELESGKSIEAVEWDITVLESYTDYTLRRLDCHVKITEDDVLKNITLQYADTAESFPTGQICFREIGAGVSLSAINISEGFTDFPEINRPYSNGRYLTCCTMFDIDVVNNYGEVTLTEIDLGFDDCLVDMDSFKKVDSGIIEYDKYKGNTIYARYREKEEAVTHGKVTIPADEESTFVASICGMSSDELVVYYINPVYTLEDQEGNPFLWAYVADDPAPAILPAFSGDEGDQAIRELLEEEGR